MKEIQLTQGKVALVDDDDYERLSAHTWRAESYRGRWFALRVDHVDGVQVVSFMHREVGGAPDDIFVEHRNENGLDNQKANLWSYRVKIKTYTLGRPNISGFNGVSWVTCLGKWKASFNLHGKRKHAGYFDTPEEAHVAWCVASQVLGGSFVRVDA